MNTATTLSPITTGSKLVIAKGCRDREITKGARAVVEAVENKGAEYGHCVKVTLLFPIGGRRVVFYARHANRLSDAVIGMNDGNPMHRIEVRRA